MPRVSPPYRLYSTPSRCQRQLSVHGVNFTGAAADKGRGTQPRWHGDAVYGVSSGRRSWGVRTRCAPSPRCSPRSASSRRPPRGSRCVNAGQRWAVGGQWVAGQPTGTARTFGGSSASSPHSRRIVVACRLPHETAASPSAMPPHHPRTHPPWGNSPEPKEAQLSHADHPINSTF